jgi:DNA-binding MurR/RpiR family transcriptional regulator
MTYALHHIDKRVFLINGLGGMYEEQVKSIGDNDALMVISFSPYAEETRKLAAAARERNIPLVVITDSNVSPLAQLADVYFVVQEAEVKGFRGLAASLCLAQTLAIALGVRHELTSAMPINR